MLLIIPAIDILNGRSAYRINGLEGPGERNNPVEIARLLRTENAKTLHVTDLGGARTGTFTEFDTIHDLVMNVDIPIEVSGGITTEDEATRLLDMGACRVVLHPGLLTDNPPEAERILGKNGPGKTVVAIESRMSADTGDTAPPHPSGDPLNIGRTALRMGFRRLLYTGLDAGGTHHVLTPAMIRSLATETGLRVTVSGGITSLHDLQVIQDLGVPGVDSVVLRKSLYENEFSCQKIWRIAEAGRYPYTAKV